MIDTTATAVETAPVAETRYARSGELHIAYQILGDAGLDLVYTPGFVSHVEIFQEEPHMARHLRRIQSFARLLMFDKRGTGMSDPWHAVPTMDERMDDIRAVMDDAGIERAALFGVSEGGPLSLVFAATYPERVSALVIYASGARFSRAEDYPWGPSLEAVLPLLELMERRWGDASSESVAITAPSLADDQRFVEEWARARRRSASPRMGVDLLRMNLGIDVRGVLEAISVPTLVLHRTGDRFVDIAHGRYLAEHIPGAQFVELPGEDHIPFVNDEDLLDEVEGFLTGSPAGGDTDRALATVLFSDIVGSTELAARVGDREWRALLDIHDLATTRAIERYGGRAVKSTGDGFLATFDRPGRAIEAATAVVEEVRRGGVEVRVGLHTGEIELRGGDVGGLAVHIGARIAALAGTGEVLVSRTVKDLVAGGRTSFTDRGTVELRGVPDSWQLYAVR